MGDSVSGDTPSHQQDAHDRFVERRAVPRYDLIAEIEAYEPLEGLRVTSSVSDIGANGCCVCLPNSLRQHTVIELRIDKGRESFKSWGMVIYAQEGRGTGINFYQPEPGQVGILQGWIANLEVQR